MKHFQKSTKTGKRVGVEELLAEIAALELKIAQMQTDYDGLQQLYDEAPLGYQSLDENCCFISVNKTWLDILGYRRDEVVGRSFADFIHPEWQSRFRESHSRFKESGHIRGVEFMMRRKDGNFILVTLDGKIGYHPDGRFHQTHCVFRDITADKTKEARHTAERRLLRICHLSANLGELIGDLIIFFKEWTNCQAVGIRLRQGDDYPYYESCGFSPYFIQAENFLCQINSEGGIIRDEAGNAVLECMCGNVLAGRVDPSQPFFTERGSFWTNSTSELLARTTENDRQGRTRNRCPAEGYESLALIPFRLREEVYGLLQLNDKISGRFTPELISQFEELAAYVSLSLSKHMADASRQESEERYRSLFESSPNAIFLTIPDGRIISANPAACAMFGMTEEEILKAGRDGLMDPNDPRNSAAIAERRRTGRVTKAELWYVKKNGEQFFGEVDSVILPGEPLRSFVIIRDITERKKAEEQLRDSEARFRAVHENSLGRFTILRPLCDNQGNIIDFTFVYQNAEAARTTGQTPEDLIGLRLSEVYSTAPQRRFFALYKRVVETGQVLECEEHYHADGLDEWFHVTVTPIPDGIAVASQIITERKRAEEALRMSEELRQAAEVAARERQRFLNVLDTLPVIIDIIRPDGRIEWANRAYREALGDNIGKLCYKSQFGFDTFCAECQAFTPLKTGRPHHWEWTLLDGRTFDIYNYPFLAADGSPAILEMDLDITDRLEAEKTLRQWNETLELQVAERTAELRESEERFRVAQELSPDGFLVFRPLRDKMGLVTDFLWVYENHAAARMNDTDMNEVAGKRLSEVLPNHEKSPFHKAYKEVAEKGKVRVVEEAFYDQDTFQQRRWFRVVAVPTAGGDVAVLAQDVTERKRAVEALRQREEELRALVENAPDVISLFDRNLRRIYVNSLVKENTGADASFMTGKTLAEAGYPEKFTQPFNAALQNVLSKGLAETIELEYEAPRGRISLQIRFAPIHDVDGSVLRVMSIGRDISDRKKYEEELKTLNDELERRVELRTLELQETQAHLLHAEKLSAIGRLSASIAHEFNNPLQGIMAILKGLQKTEVLEKQDRRFLDLAFSECERMKNLIRNLQDFNRPSSGRKIFMDVHVAIDSLLLLTKSDLKRKGISTVVQYAQDLPQILAIPDQIKQVILNLLQNAADACDGSNGVITIRTCHENGRIAVAIKDNGVGIPPNKISQIFQPFYTTKPEIKGTGLGLSICHGIVQNHNGEILVESEPGKGSIFTVLLPIVGESM